MGAGISTSKTGIIKSIQRGTIAMSSSEITKTATVNSVDTAKSVLNFLGSSCDTLNGGPGFIRLSLTNSTTVTADRGIHGSSAATASYEVIEYY